jgi:hypothetical protein
VHPAVARFCEAHWQEPGGGWQVLASLQTAARDPVAGLAALEAASPETAAAAAEAGLDATRLHTRSRATRSQQGRKSGSDAAAPGGTGAAGSGRGTGRGHGRGRSGPQGVAAAITKRQRGSPGKQQGPAKRMQAKGGGQKRPRALALS